MQIDDIRSALIKAFESVRPSKSAQRCATAALETAFRKDGRMDPLRDALRDVDLAREAGLTSSTMLDMSKTVVDLRGFPGLLFLPELCDEVTSRARKNGFGALGLRNSAGVHQLEPYVREIARCGQLGLFLWNGGSYTVVPYGGTDPRLGTNPLAYAVPYGEQCFSADFSTSEIPFLQLMHAIRQKEPIPENAGVDDRGTPTTNPHEVYDLDADGPVRLLPMGGGPKGYALALLIEILTGALVGGAMGRVATDDPFTPSEFGGLMLAFDVSAFGNGAQFDREVSEFLEDLRTTPSRPGYGSVRVPGDNSSQRYDTVMRSSASEVSVAAMELLRPWLDAS